MAKSERRTNIERFGDRRTADSLVESINKKS
jgi:hypothetical protein